MGLTTDQRNDLEEAGFPVYPGSRISAVRQAMEEYGDDFLDEILGKIGDSTILEALHRSLELVDPDRIHPRTVFAELMVVDEEDDPDEYNEWLNLLQTLGSEQATEELGYDWDGGAPYRHVDNVNPTEHARQKGVIVHAYPPFYLVHDQNLKMLSLWKRIPHTQAT